MKISTPSKFIPKYHTFMTKGQMVFFPEDLNITLGKL